MMVSFWVDLDQFNSIQTNFHPSETVEITAWNHSAAAPLTTTVIRCVISAENIFNIHHGGLPGELKIKFRKPY